MIVKVVDEVDTGHADLVTLLWRQFPQRLVEGLRPHVEAAVHGNTTGKPGTKPQGSERLTGRFLAEICFYSVIVTQAQASATEFHCVPENAVLNQPVDIPCPQRRIDQPFPNQHIQHVQRGLEGNFAPVNESLQAGMIKHFSLQNALLHQIQEAIHHHFTTAIQAGLERTGTAAAVNHREPGSHIQVVINCAPGIIVLVAQNGVVNQRGSQ